jgi:Arylsulfotransferase (ASST)
MLSRAIALACLLFAFVSISGCGDSSAPESSSSPSVAISGLYPEFDSAKRHYVSRCGRGAEPIRVDAADGTAVAVGSGEPRTGSIAIGGEARPGTNFVFTIDNEESRRQYDVRCLPADFPDWRFQRLGSVGPGLFAVSFRESREARPWVIVFDHEGAPRWWYSPSTRALWAQVLRDGSIAWARSFGDGYGLDPRMAYEIRSPAGRLIRVVRTKGEIIDGHELRELDSGNLLLDTYAPGTKVNLRRFGGPRSASAVFAEIQEVRPDGRVAWHWNSRGKIGLGETGRWWRNVLSNAKVSARGIHTFDPVHINSIEPRGSDELVVSMRHTDAIYGIERSTGEILWKLGGTETPDSLRIVGDPAVKLFGGQHDARVDETGDISVYDNGKDRPRRPRVVSYRLDLKRRTATYQGQLNDPRIKASHCCGSARPLAGGGWLVSWGDNPLVTGFDGDGETAFRLELPASTFRAVPVPPDATTVATLDRGLEAMESR